MLEIELKARVRDPREIRQKLSLFMEYQSQIEKNDEYWIVPLAMSESNFFSGTFRVRLRQEPGRVLVTFKEKSYQEGLEVNKEVEFGVSDAVSFRHLLEKMSAKIHYRKRKTGTLWKMGDSIIAELVNVEGLGDFLEVETMYEESENIDLRALKISLLGIIRKSGLMESDIEPRPYSQLLGIL
jgi:predicted adenylyl cyclase CyaB